MTAEPIHVISLGAGVQSTTMALMAAHGEITPMPDAAIFSDTGWEPRRVYEHLNWLMSPNVLPFPVHVVSAGNIREDIMRAWSARTRSAFASVPWHLKKIKKNGSYTAGMGKRQCTAHYKLEPIAKQLRVLLDKPGRAYIAPGSVTIWIGISKDEAWRRKPPQRKYQTGRWPLLEANMRRSGCYGWLEIHGYPVVRPEHATPENPTWPPKSSCIGCPFHDDDQWIDIMADPFTRADVIEVDGAIRHGGSVNAEGERTMKAEQYMHNSLMPIDQVKFETGKHPDLFNNECEGMCGV